MTLARYSIDTGEIRPKPWGQELVFAAIENSYVGKLITLNAGESVSLQRHENKHESIFILVGTADFELGDAVDQLDSHSLQSNDCVHIPAGVIHRITATSQLQFVEVSTAFPGWSQDVERLEDRYGRSGTQAP